LLLGFGREIGSHHGAGNDHEPGNQRPRSAGLLAEQGEQAAEHGNQREGPQAGRRVGAPLALHADQQADAQRRGKGLDRRSQFGSDETHGFSLDFALFSKIKPCHAITQSFLLPAADRASVPEPRSNISTCSDGR
jgi:hypothetical protein